jgi:phosphatidylinositol 4-kinase
MAMFTPLAISAGVETWTKVLKQRVDAEVTIFGEITAGWLDTIRRNKGLFSTSMKKYWLMGSYTDPFEVPIEYTPSDKKTMDLEMSKANKMLRPHHLLIKVLATQYQGMKNREAGVTVSLVRLLMRSLGAARKMRSASVLIALGVS